MYLENKNDEDAEEIEEILTQYEAFQERSFYFKYNIIVANNRLNVSKIKKHAPHLRVVYKRKEY